MGCNNSKIDNEEGVARCKQRKRVMRDVVASRHNFAASHVMFIKSLGDVGVAFRVFAEGETTKEHIMYSEVSTPRTPTLSLGPPPATLHPPPPFSPGFSPSPPPHSPPSPHVKLSALRFQNGSPITRAVSSPESFAQEFFPPPPPPVALKEHRMEHTPSASITNIYRFNEGSSNSYKSYRLEGSPPPPPFQPIQMDDDWKYSGRRAPPSNAARENNPPPPPPVTRSSWQDLFMDPFRPSPPVFNYMEERRNPDVGSKQSQEIEEQKRRQESERKRNHEAEHRRMKEEELGRKHDIEQRIHEERRKAHELEERRNRELEQRRREESSARPPPVRIVEVKPKNFVDDIPDLEEDDIPELEDVDEDIDWPPPEDLANGKNIHAVKKPQSAPEPSPKRAPEPSPKPAPEQSPKPSPKPIPEPPPKPAAELSPEPTPEKIPEPVPKPAAPKPAAPEPAASEPALPKSVPEPVPDPKTPPKTPSQTPPKFQEPPPKAGKAAKTPGKPPKPEFSIAKTNKDLAVSKAEKGGRDLLEVLKEVDVCFVKAAESGEIVSTLLDTKKAHYHSNFSDSLRGVGESARMNLLRLSGKSGSSSFRTTSNLSSLSNTSVLNDESPSIMSIRRSISNLSSARFAEECGPPTHASTLDKLFAWEKKLYLEVKEAEALRVELERKFYLYRSQDAKNEDPAIIDKTRSSIKTLQTRMAVAVHAVESAAQQVQRLRDVELYPQLVDLLDGLGTMWKNMSQAHQAQLRAVETMRRLDNSAACEPTTSFHRQATLNLEQALNKWSEGVSRFVNSHKEYLKNLTLWLKLTLQQSSNDEGDSRSGSRSPSRSPRSSSSEGMIGSSIYDLCQRWEEALALLPHQVVLEGIGSFSSVVREMLRLQWEELRIKKRVENYQKDLERRELALHTVASKDPGPGFHDGSRSQTLTLRSPTTTSGSDADDGRFDMVVSSGFSERSEVAEKRLKFEAARRKYEAELEAERKAYTDTRAFTLSSLQSGLPQLFQAVTTFANSEADIYDQLSTAHSLLNK